MTTQPSTSGSSAECHGKRELGWELLLLPRKYCKLYLDISMPKWLDKKQNKKNSKFTKGRERDIEVKRDKLLLVCTARFQQQDFHFHKIGKEKQRMDMYVSISR